MASSFAALAGFARKNRCSVWGFSSACGNGLPFAARCSSGTLTMKVLEWKPNFFSMQRSISPASRAADFVLLKTTLPLWM